MSNVKFFLKKLRTNILKKKGRTMYGAADPLKTPLLRTFKNLLSFHPLDVYRCTNLPASAYITSWRN